MPGKASGMRQGGRAAQNRPKVDGAGLRALMKATEGGMRCSQSEVEARLSPGLLLACRGPRCWPEHLGGGGKTAGCWSEAWPEFKKTWSKQDVWIAITPMMLGYYINFSMLTPHCQCRASTRGHWNFSSGAWFYGLCRFFRRRDGRLIPKRRDSSPLFRLCWRRFARQYIPVASLMLRWWRGMGINLSRDGPRTASPRRPDLP